MKDLKKKLEFVESTLCLAEDEMNEELDTLSDEDLCGYIESVIRDIQKSKKIVEEVKSMLL